MSLFGASIHIGFRRGVAAFAFIAAVLAGASVRAAPQDPDLPRSGPNGSRTQQQPPDTDPTEELPPSRPNSPRDRSDTGDRQSDTPTRARRQESGRADSDGDVAPSRGSGTRNRPSGGGSPGARRVGSGRPTAGVVPDTTRYPFSAVCKIRATYSDGTVVEGSGVMIGPHHCLTALHLLYNVRTREGAREISVSPGYALNRSRSQGLQSRPFGETRKGEYLYWEAQDIAVLVTSTNIGELSSWMTMEAHNDQMFKNGDYSVAGYAPGVADGEEQSSFKTAVLRVDGDRLTLDSAPRVTMVGAPIFARGASRREDDQEIYSVVGVQTGENTASRIPPDMLRALRRFVRDDFAGVKAAIPLPGGNLRRSIETDRDDSGR